MAKLQAFLANVMDAYVYAGADLLFTSKALTNSSISIGVTAEEIRAGKGNKLIGRFFHDSTFGLELQDALFNLSYIAYNVGSEIVSGNSESLKEEQITATGSGALTVSGTPADFMGQGKIGWIAEVGSDEWGTFEFTGDTASATGVTLADGSTILADTTYCVKYMNVTACDEVVIPSDFIPNEVSVVLKGNLYKASKGNDVSTASLIGYVEVEVPRFQLNGSMEISLNASGASQIPFAGQALVTTDASAGCEGGGYYAKIRDIRKGAQWYDNCIALALEGSDSISIAANASKTLRVYAVNNNGSSKLVDASNLDFTLDPTSLGTISNGVYTAGSSTGTGTLSIAIADNAKPSVGLSVDVTVTA